MDAIFSIDDLPKRRLAIKSTLANRFASDVGREVVIMRDKIARQIAQKCAECDDLVTITPNGPFLEVRADCIIMTTDELAELMRKQFRSGIEHATHFMPLHDRAPTHQAAPQTSTKEDK